eukprot:SAG31_NODE_18542_length_632_cov_1.348968_1_plen_88_part_10
MSSVTDSLLGATAPGSGGSIQGLLGNGSAAAPTSGSTAPTSGLSATRWWILLSFCALSLSQASAWNFYAPVSFAAAELYGWNNNTIAW